MISQGRRKFVVDIGHPANVHLFKYFFHEMRLKGWQGLFSVTDKEVTLNLLNAYALPYVVLGKNKPHLLAKLTSLIVVSYKFLRLLSEYKPDVILSRGSLHSALVSWIKGIPHIVLSDTEGAGLLNKIAGKMASVILTSDSYRSNHGARQIRYPSYHELAYLHPNRFVPNRGFLELLGLRENERFAFIRLVSWTAHHDVGQNGLCHANRLKLVNELQKSMRVFISSEGMPSPELAEHMLKLEPQLMHDLLFCADLVVSEGATVASESACLGTPTVYVNSSQLGYTNDLAKYGLLFSYTGSATDQRAAIAESIGIATSNNFKRILADKRNKMLDNRIDLTAFLMWFVDDYPQSALLMKQPGFDFDQFRFSVKTD